MESVASVRHERFCDAFEWDRDGKKVCDGGGRFGQLKVEKDLAVEFQRLRWPGDHTDDDFRRQNSGSGG